jgi:fatty acid desaturase
MAADEPAGVAAVAWKDLTELSRPEIVHEVLVSLPWLAGSWAAAAHDLQLLALACSFMFFLTGLRQVHNAYHYALGLPRAATEALMLALSALMLGSMHAVQINHLRHHRHCLGPEDVEAMGARLPAWRAILLGPVFPVRMHVKALEVASAPQRRWIVAELAVNVVVIGLAWGLAEARWLRYHVTAMAIGQCLTAFFAVWTVHHDCPPGGPVARTLRSAVKAFVTYGMFYHLEHHLFPAVPTCKLSTLAERLDRAVPGLAIPRVF